MLVENEKEEKSDIMRYEQSQSNSRNGQSITLCHHAALLLGITLSFTNIAYPEIVCYGQKCRCLCSLLMVDIVTFKITAISTNF
ncbi:hypothetical protein TNCV_4882521 [Trichonephila clavipes]|nr:hypothetical protein TNCV_4882521 [Trichonephila clavipes]